MRLNILPFCLLALAGSCLAQEDRDGGPNTTIAVLSTVTATAAPILLANHLSNVSHGEHDNLVLGLYLGGAMIGPSVGQFYAGSVKQGLIGTGIRAVGGSAALVGFAVALGDALCGMDDDGESHPACGDGSGAAALMVAGAGVYLVGALYSLFDTPGAVDRAHRNESRFSLAPTVIPGSQGALSPGLAASYRF